MENAKVTTKSLQTDTIINVIVFIFILFNYFYNSIVDGGFEPWTSQLETPIGDGWVSRQLAYCCHFNNIINESLSYFFCDQWHISL